MFSLSKSSSDKLLTCDERLIVIATEAITVTPYDFSIIEGHRSLERQQELFNQRDSDGNRLTNIDGIEKKGNHNYTPSRAFDFMPYPSSVNGVIVWDDFQRFSVIAGVMFAIAAQKKIKIRWGGDWDGDGNAKDQSLYDLPHIELIG